MDVNAIDLTGADGLRADLEQAAAENVKRVVLGSPDAQSLYEISAFLELKTVWHPDRLVGADRDPGLGRRRDDPAARVPVPRLRRGTREGGALLAHGAERVRPRPGRAHRHAGGVQAAAEPLRRHAHRGRPLFALAPGPHAGRRVWEARNFDFRSWPPRYETTPVYVPERVWGDFETHYGLADQFRFLERQGTVKIELLAENGSFELDGTRVTAVRSMPRTRRPSCSSPTASAC
jgi:hypothetical protein